MTNDNSNDDAPDAHAMLALRVYAARLASLADEIAAAGEACNQHRLGTPTRDFVARVGGLRTYAAARLRILVAPMQYECMTIHSVIGRLLAWCDEHDAALEEKVIAGVDFQRPATEPDDGRPMTPATAIDRVRGCAERMRVLAEEITDTATEMRNRYPDTPTGSDVAGLYRVVRTLQFAQDWTKSVVDDIAAGHKGVAGRDDGLDSVMRDMEAFEEMHAEADDR